MKSRFPCHAEPRPLKRLYDRREETLAMLREDFLQAKNGKVWHPRRDA